MDSTQTKNMAHSPQHASDNASANRAMAGHPGTAGKRQRNYAENEFQERHYHQAKPQARRLNRRLREAPSACSTLTNSTMRIAFLAERPMSVINRFEIDVIGIPIIVTANTEPSMPTGTISNAA